MNKAASGSHVGPLAPARPAGPDKKQKGSIPVRTLRAFRTLSNINLLSDCGALKMTPEGPLVSLGAAMPLSREIERLRAEHAALIALARIVTELLQAPGPAQPTQLASARARLRELEMGDLAEEYVAYDDKWTTESVAARWEEFSRETIEVFGLLAVRVEREERELYPLADRLYVVAAALGPAFTDEVTISS